jgi:hypothetical protein
MTLHQLMAERIFIMMSDEDLIEMYCITSKEVNELSDLDLFEMYEEIMENWYEELLQR